VARLYSAKLTTQLSQSFFVESRPGPNGIVVANATISAPADGYTLAFSSIGGQVLQPAINAYLKKPQEPNVLRLLVPVSLLAITPLALVVNPSSGVNSVKDLIAYAKADRGKLNYGTAGAGGSDHLSTELFNQAAGITAVHVPYKGQFASVNALLSGEIHYSFPGLGGVLPYHRSGKLKILAIGGPSRSAKEILPEVPTLAEAANLPGFDVSSWFAMFAREGTDPAIVSLLSREIQKAAEAPDLIDRLKLIGIDAKGSTPEQLAAQVDADLKTWGNLLRTGNVKF